MSALEDIQHDANMSATWAAEALRDALAAKEEADELIARLVALAAQVDGAEGAQEVRDWLSDMAGDTFDFWLQLAESEA